MVKQTLAQAQVVAAAAQAHVLGGVTLQTKEAIKSGQDGIRKSLVKLDAQIHENAIQCLVHCSVHGDTSLMRRLLVDILNGTGYRAQGLINWMRKHSPMELKGDVITASAVIESPAQAAAMAKMFPNADPALFVVGNKRPFMIEEANATPFTRDSANNERVARPIYQDTLTSKIDALIREFERTSENTVNGKPVDPSKPYFDGIHQSEVADFMAEMKKRRETLPADATREVRLRQQRMKEDAEYVASVGNVEVPAEAQKVA